MRCSCSAQTERGYWEDSSGQQQTCDLCRLSKSIKQRDLPHPADFVHPIPTLSTPSPPPTHMTSCLQFLMAQKEALARTLTAVYIFLLQAIFCIRTLYHSLLKILMFLSFYLCFLCSSNFASAFFLFWYNNFFSLILFSSLCLYRPSTFSTI